MMVHKKGKEQGIANYERTKVQTKGENPKNQSGDLGGRKKVEPRKERIQLNSHGCVGSEVPTQLGGR